MTEHVPHDHAHGQPSRGARLALIGFAAAMLLAHGVLAWLSPLSGGDWTHALDDGGLATHYTLGDAAGHLLAVSPLVHVIVTPVISLALVVGMFVLAFRRLPRPDAWSDVLALVLTSALIWITQPRAGLIWFHRPYAALYLYGAALAVWFAAPYVCRWSLAGWQRIAVVLGGAVVGTASRQLAVVVLIGLTGFVLRTPRAERRWWMWGGLSTLLIGTVAGFVDPPRLAFPRMMRRGFEAGMKSLNLPLREGGELIALVLLVILAKLLVDSLRSSPPARALPDPRASLRWLAIWFGLCVFSQFGPRASEGTLLPATVVLCIAALPYLTWASTTGLVRQGVWVIAIGIHLVAWAVGVRTLAPLAHEHRARIAIVAATPAGEVAVAPPYSQIAPGFWFLGEDWLDPATRRQIAIERFGVRDIELSRVTRDGAR